jgi:hypothetical protein
VIRTRLTRDILSCSRRRSASDENKITYRGLGRVSDGRHGVFWRAKQKG